MQPTLTHENNDYVFTLWRDGKEVVHAFKDAFAAVSYGNEKSIPVNHLAKMNGPSYDGWTYHIYVQQHYKERDTEEIFIWLSKEEFETLWPMLDSPEDEPEDDPYAQQEVMRALMREYRY